MREPIAGMRGASSGQMNSAHDGANCAEMVIDALPPREQAARDESDDAY